jgi:hypothetical protein
MSKRRHIVCGALHEIDTRVMVGEQLSARQVPSLAFVRVRAVGDGPSRW